MRNRTPAELPSSENPPSFPRKRESSDFQPAEEATLDSRFRGNDKQGCSRVELQERAFSDLYEMSSGISSTPAQAGHGTPFLSFSTVFNNYFLPDVLPDLMDTSESEQEAYSIREGDIFLTRTSETVDELGMSCVALKDHPHATFSGFLKRLRPTLEGQTDPRFMAFYLRSPLFRKTMTNNAVMVLRASLNEQIFSYLKLLLPDFDTQTRIGEFLYLLNAKIDLNQRINAELEALAKTIYDYWFVQFDFPDAHGRPYKSSGGAMVWNDTLKREIPAGWAARALSELVRVSTASVEPGAEVDRIFKHLSIPGLDSSGSFLIERGGDIGSNKFSVAACDLLVSKLNPWFSRVFADTGYDDLICSTEFVVWRCATKTVQAYLHSIATSARFIAYCAGSATGTSNSHKRVNPQVMMRYQVPYAACQATAFGELAAPILEQCIRNTQQNRELTRLRDWLLPLLMNGQVRVA